MGGDHSDQPGLLPGVSNRKRPVDQNVVGAFALNSPKEPGLFKYEPIPAAELARAEALPPPPPPTHPPSSLAYVPRRGRLDGGRGRREGATREGDAPRRARDVLG